jgi:hypothetical protein
MFFDGVGLVWTYQIFCSLLSCRACAEAFPIQRGSVRPADMVVGELDMVHMASKPQGDGQEFTVAQGRV